jgi:DNA-binding beta-propeller fold protein YncE
LRHGPQSHGVAASPDGKLLFVTDYGTVTVAGGLMAYTLDPDGTPFPEQGYVTGLGPKGVAVTPNSKFVYAANSYSTGSGGLTGFFTHTYGYLGALSSNGFDTGSVPTAVAISPDGRCLYVTNSAGGSIKAFTIGSDGLLTALGLYTAGSQPQGIVVSPNGMYLYASNYGSSTGANGISAYLIGSDGTLSAITSGILSTGSRPRGIAVSPDGLYLYVGNWTDNTVSAYSFGSGGELGTIGTYPVGLNPYAIAISPKGI